MRALLASVLGCAVLLAAAGSAAAEPNDLERGRAEIDKASVLVDRALEAVKDGDRERAYRLARSAYLDHYEFVEIPMRLRDPNKVLDTEFKFAAMRNDIRDGAPLSDIRRDVADVREGLVASDRVLAEKGFAAPAIAFGFSFSILFREGIEAVLLIAILLGSLSAGSAHDYKRPLGLGVLAALGATAGDLGARDAGDRHSAGEQGIDGGDHRFGGGRRARDSELLARLAARAPAPPGVHARASR